VPFDCRECGACCKNPAVNRAEGFIAYVEIDDPKSKLLLDASLRRKHVTFDEERRPHLRLHGDRCSALAGTIGREVRCMIYAHRPRPCRRVQPGDADCMTARAEHGLPLS
jgi:Fe-S-cluster containining protein